MIYLASLMVKGWEAQAMKGKFHLLKRRALNPTRIVAGSFAVIIALGTILLSLPVASRSGQSAGVLTSLFTATSSTCVTGLVVADTATQWSMFGQVVILAMIQLGGLGFITIMTLFSLIIHRKIGLSERLILVSSLNLNNMNGVVRLIRFTLRWTLCFEGVGALILMLRFIPRYGLGQGIWMGIFHSVSAFCNAGFDLLGLGAPYQSLIPFQRDPVVLFTVMALIFIGGLGFFVWKDIAENRRWKKFSLYTKMVLVMSGALILLGWVILFAVEWQNPATLGNMPLGDKLMNALFQSVTFRTAGFSAIDQGGLRDTSQALGCILMVIGGSSGSTAGGIKTVTVAVLGLSVLAGFRGRSGVTIAGRSIDRRQQTSATTLALTALLFFLFGSMFLSLFDAIPFMDAGFEVASALGTVGLTVGITPTLSIPCRVFLILFMYLGRVGILSCSIAFSTLRSAARETKIKYPVTDVMIG